MRAVRDVFVIPRSSFLIAAATAWQSRRVRYGCPPVQYSARSRSVWARPSPLPGDPSPPSPQRKGVPGSPLLAGEGLGEGLGEVENRRLRIASISSRKQTSAALRNEGVKSAEGTGCRPKGRRDFMRAERSPRGFTLIE